MTIKFTAKLTGTALDLKKFGSKIKKAIPRTLKEIGRDQQMDTRRRIAISKTDPVGARWAPWAFSTLQTRIRKGNAALGLLYDTGDLWRSIKYSVRGDTLTLGSTLDYANYLQEGTRYMPPRQIVNFNTRQMKKQVKKALLKNLRLK